MSRPNRNARRAQATIVAPPVANKTPAQVDIAATSTDTSIAATDTETPSEAAAAPIEVVTPAAPALAEADSENEPSEITETEPVSETADDVQTDKAASEEAAPTAVQVDVAAKTSDVAPEATDVAPTTDQTADEEAEAPMRWLKMKISMSGTEFSLSRGWKHRFCDKPGPNGEASEAQRLVDAGFAVDTDAPKA